jgi:hypothetical protein
VEKRGVIVSDRVFPEVPIQYGDKATKALRIGCASCDGVAYFPHQTGNSRKPPIAAVQHFQNKGWVVGSGPRKDFCPIHATPARRKVTETMAETTAPMAEKPRVMSREDRAIIFDKLNEVYGKDAYKAPWTDTAVAKDLGVPRDWVTSMRDDMFGPAGSNPLFDQILSEAEKLEAIFKSHAENYDTAIRATDAYLAGHKDLCKRMDEFRALSRRVAREIGR